MVDVNKNGERCYKCSSPTHKRNQCPTEIKVTENRITEGTGNPRGRKLGLSAIITARAVTKKKDCLKKHPELIPDKFVKSGAAILEEILVTSVVDLNVPANTEHMFGFENENFAHTSTNIFDLKSFMVNGDDLNNVFLVRKEDDITKEHHQFS